MQGELRGQVHARIGESWDFFQGDAKNKFISNHEHLYSKHLVSQAPVSPESCHLKFLVAITVKSSILLHANNVGKTTWQSFFRVGEKKLPLRTPQRWKPKAGLTLILSEKQKCETKGFQQRLLQRLKR